MLLKNTPEWIYIYAIFIAMNKQASERASKQATEWGDWTDPTF